MLLGIDTATRWMGLSLHDGATVITEMGWRCFNTHTIELTPAIDGMLKRSGSSVADLKGIAVAIGPGSYTGLRVGLAMAKGLALANQIPLIGVSTLDVVATSFGPSERQLLVAAAAGRTRVSAAVYQWQNGQWKADAVPVIESWETLLAGLNGEAMTFAGEISPEAAKQIRAASKNYHVALPASSVRRAGYLAELGWQRLRSGLIDDAPDLTPVYLRDPAGK